MKRILFITFAVPVLGALACAHAPGHLEREIPCAASTGCLTFRVSDDSGSRAAAGAPVLLAAGGEMNPLGRTDEDGLFSIAKERLASGSVILFCWDPTSLACTAVRLDTHTATAYEWLNVTLPKNRLVHRSQAVAAPDGASPSSRPPLP
jgi:hypothetical protein